MENIISIPSQLQEEQSSPGLTIGAYHYAECPFCRASNKEWQYSIEKSKQFSANNKCKHFVDIVGKNFVFEGRPECCVTDSRIMFGGVNFPRAITQYEEEDTWSEDLLDGLPRILFCCQSNGYKWNGERLSALLRILTKKTATKEEFQIEERGK